METDMKQGGGYVQVVVALTSSPTRTRAKCPNPILASTAAASLRHYMKAMSDEH